MPTHTCESSVKGSPHQSRTRPASIYAEGSQLQADACTESTTQLWTLHGGYPYDLSNSWGWAVSVAGGSAANGAKVIQWKYQGTPDQWWAGAGFN
jgi:hypothetical protein